ncbi:MAG: DUF4097 family beta strand repeat-containing protein [Gemmatimonadaceae bacterium]
MIKHILRATTLSAVLAGTAMAQATTTPPDFRWEKALPAGSMVRLHNLNGDITVTAGTGDRVEIVGIKRGSRRSFEDVTIEVVETTDGIVACAMFRDLDMECGEDGMRTNDRRRRRGDDDRDWDDASIAMQVRLPRGMRLHAGTVSGDVTVAGAEGDVRVSSVSGDVEARQLRATGVRARSVSGDVLVSIVALTGEGDLHLSSVSGDVIAELPKDINADVTMRSVSGSLDTEFPVTLNGRVRRSSLEARIGQGGRDLDVTTVSGDVTLRAVRP